MILHFYVWSLVLYFLLLQLSELVCPKTWCSRVQLLGMDLMLLFLRFVHWCYSRSYSHSSFYIATVPAEQRLSNFSHPKTSLGFEFFNIFTTLDFINCSN
jgi:hypothetical protein